jgi:hypothetical protein
MRYYSMAIVAVMIILGHSVFAQKKHHYPIIAHAHNDYDQKKPLYSALRQILIDFGIEVISIDHHKQFSKFALKGLKPKVAAKH